MKKSRIFVVLQSYIRSCILLFEKAKQLGMMEKGYVWIISDDIASLLDSVDQSVVFSMQGVVGFKTNFAVTSVNFREFKLHFRRKFRRKYPDEEEYSNPSIYALRTYDATWAVLKAIQASKGSSSPVNFFESISHSEFNGLSGDISFKAGKIAPLSTFHIINVIGKSHREIGFWSQESGFSSDNLGLEKANLGLIYWPGGTHIIPTGQVLREKGKPLKIGVPPKDPLKQILKVSYDPDKNKTNVSSFSKIFDAVMKQLSYWPYESQTLESEHKPLKVGVPAEAIFNQFVEVSYDQDKNKTYVTGTSIDVLEAVVKEHPYPWSCAMFAYILGGWIT